jgi:hypothetical protein
MRAKCAATTLAVAVAAALAVAAHSVFGTPPWTQPLKPGRRLGPAADNLCVNGVLLPRLYLLGAQRAGSTGFALKLSKAAGVRSAWKAKEFHFFDRLQEACTRDLVDPTRLYSGTCTPNTTEWRAALKKGAKAGFKKAGKKKPKFCKAEAGAPRTVLADYTPINLKYVDLPEVLKQLYGSLLDELVFLVLVREPVARAQSAYWIGIMRHGYHIHTEAQAARVLAEHGKPHNFTLPMAVKKKCEKWDTEIACKTSFAHNLEVADALTAAGLVTDSLWRGQYAAQLRPYLAVFKPSQFVVIPSHFATTHFDKVLADDVAPRLKLSSKTFVHQKDTVHNKHRHPPLEEDLLNAENQKKWKEWSDMQTDDLAELLTKHRVNQPDGIRLSGYNGNSGDVTAVKKFLMENW